MGTFRMLAQLPSDSMGAYIISMSHTASDVLAVVLLQKECGGELACWAPGGSLGVWRQAAGGHVHPLPLLAFNGHALRHCGSRPVQRCSSDHPCPKPSSHAVHLQ